MRMIPVLDIKQGKVVRGIAGRRREYLPIVSRLTPSAEPVGVAMDMKSVLGVDHFYLADLDAIEGAPPSVDLYQTLSQHGIRLWVDAGIIDEIHLSEVDHPSVAGWVIGLETLASVDALSRLMEQFGADRIIFSLDLKQGVPLARSAFWKGWSAARIGERVLALGVRQMIILDLSCVGMDSGWGGGDHLAEWSSRYPAVDFFVAGGVRDIADLKAASSMGAAGALVASALHDGKIGPTDLAPFASVDS
jgi:phosphoribosylformimino-5-aminoimidazole carboxamide ribotide isomerase